MLDVHREEHSRLLVPMIFFPNQKINSKLVTLVLFDIKSTVVLSEKEKNCE